MDRREFVRLAGMSAAGLPFILGHGSQAASPPPQDGTTAVWIDSDIGADIDDAVCLLCAARHPRIELVGVSTGKGCIGSAQAAAWVAQELLRRAKRPEVPVLTGALISLAGNGPCADLGTYGALAPKMEPIPTTPEADDERIDRIADAMRSVGKPFHLLTIGALTNAARLTSRHPDVADRWQAVTCMAGMLTGGPECNARMDAIATRLVCEKLNPTLIGMEACGQNLPRDAVDAALDLADPASAFLSQCYAVYRSQADWSGVPDPDKRPLTLFDPISLLSLVYPQAFDFQNLRLVVEQDGKLRRSDAGYPVRYAVSNHWDVLRPIVIKLLGGEDVS